MALRGFTLRQSSKEIGKEELFVFHAIYKPRTLLQLKYM